MKSKADWARDLFAGLAKVFVVITSADIVARIFSDYRDLAYGIGLLLGVVLQHEIPPKVRWRREAMILIPVTILIAVFHAIFRR